MQVMRDYQKGKVYKWEGKNIAPHDKTNIPFDQIQSIVDYVWEKEGLYFPPKVESLPKQKITCYGDATRLAVRFHSSAPTWVILHELAHSMTSFPNEGSNLHGPLFLGVYLNLVAKYLHLPLFALAYSANKDGLKFDLQAKPLFS